MGRFPGAESCLTLVWAVLDLISTHQADGIHFNQLDRQRLNRMRYDGTEEPTPEEGRDTACCLDRRARPECSPSFATDTTAPRCPPDHRVAPNDDREAALVLEPAAPPDTRDGHRPHRPRGPDGDRQAVASRPRSRSRRRCAPARGGRCRHAGPRAAEANVPRSPASSPSTRTASLPGQPGTGLLIKCSEFLNSGGWAIQDSNLGPLPYQRSALTD